MILAVIKINALPAKRKELLQTLHALMKELRRENICKNCFVCQDIETENSFRLIEEWGTEQQLDNHLRSELFTVIIGAKNLMREPLEIKFNAVSSTAGMEIVKAARGKTSNVYS